MKKLLAYSLVESHQDTESYSMHPVVHDWCIESISRGKLESDEARSDHCWTCCAYMIGASILGDVAALTPTCQSMCATASQY